MDIAHRALRRCSEVGLLQDCEAPIGNVGVQAAVQTLTVVSASVLTTVPLPAPDVDCASPVLYVCVCSCVLTLVSPWPAKPLENVEFMGC